MDNGQTNAGIRIWPGVVIVAVQWLAVFGTGIVAPATFVQFFGMMGGPPLGLLLLLVWWAFLSRAARADKILGVVALLAVVAVTGATAHETAVPMTIFVYTIPAVCLAFVLTVLVTRRWAATPRRLALVVVLVLAGGVWALVRTEGVDGDMAAEFAWRWQPTAEERLLAAEPELASVLAPPPPAAPEVGATEDPAGPEAATPDAADPTADSGAAVAVDAEPTDAEPTDAEPTDAEPTDVDSAASAGDADTATAPAAAETPAAEWPGFRGAGRDSVIPGLRIATDWQASPPEEIWRRPVGPGWGSFVVAGDLIYTQEQRGEDEIVSAYRAETGEPVWMHRDQARFWEALAGAGPRATPELHRGVLYSLGATGILNALQADTGARMWSRNVADDTSAPVPEWGFSSSPLVVDGLVVVHTGAPEGKAVVAYDAASGEPRWTAPSGALSYSSAHLATLHGVRQLLVVTGDGVSSHAPADGTVLWQHDWSAGEGARVVQPAFTAGGDVLIGTGFGMGLRRVSVEPAGDGWQVEQKWTSPGLKPYYNDLVVHDGHAYGFDGRILAAVELETGERAWKGGRYGNGQLLLLPEQDLLLVLSDRGDLALVAAEPTAFEEIARMPAIEGKTWNHPVIAGGVLYVRNGEQMAAFRLAVEP